MRQQESRLTEGPSPKKTFFYTENPTSVNRYDMVSYMFKDLTSVSQLGGVGNRKASQEFSKTTFGKTPRDGMKRTDSPNLSIDSTLQTKFKRNRGKTEKLSPRSGDKLPQMNKTSSPSQPWAQISPRSNV